MKRDYCIRKIFHNHKVAENIYKLSIEKLEEDQNAMPGQFYMLKTLNKGATLGRPISLYNVEGHAIEFLYEAVGKGTNYISELGEGDTIEVLGPLGNGFPLDEAEGAIAIVAGGIGIAPMHELIKRIKISRGNKKIDLYAGFRDEVYEIEEIKPFINDLIISTDNGNKGYKGFITDHIDVSKYDVIFCCGPEIMMKKIVNNCKAYNTKVYVSMESHMACGIGACLVCTCKTKFGGKQVCKDGPVFLGYDLNF